MDTLTRCLCGDPATSGSERGECGRCFRERLGSVKLDPSVTATRSKTAYYDTDALDSAFGSDRVDRYWDETDGLGALHKVGDRFMHRDHKGEVRVADDKTIAAFTDGIDGEDA